MVFTLTPEPHMRPPIAGEPVSMYKSYYLHFGVEEQERVEEQGRVEVQGQERAEHQQRRLAFFADLAADLGEEEVVPAEQ